MRCHICGKPVIAIDLLLFQEKPLCSPECLMEMLRRIAAEGREVLERIRTQNRPPLL